MTSFAQSRLVPRLGFNKTEVALSLGLSIYSVDKMVADGTLPQPRRWHKRKIWLVSELEAALTELPLDGQTADPGAASDDEDWEVT